MQRFKNGKLAVRFYGLNEFFPLEEEKLISFLTTIDEIKFWAAEALENEEIQISETFLYWITQCGLQFIEVIIF